MESLGTCYIDYERYPQNLPNQDLSRRKRRTYFEQLNQNSKRLFSDDCRLSFWDLSQDAKGFEMIKAKDLESVRRLCLLGSSRQAEDDFHLLDCRFIFVYSYNSRSPLYTSREMLMLALSYHTVEPWFLDFLFLFGEQDDPQDSRFSLFRHKVYQEPQLNLKLPNLDRTGHELHLCYNLRAAEFTGKKPMLWSVRQTALYHSFDLSNGQVLFIVLKGNSSMREELKEETQGYEWKENTHASKLVNAYSAALKTHLSICWWSCDNWRPFINYLEATMKALTQNAITQEVQRRPAPIRNEERGQQRRKSFRRILNRSSKAKFASKSVNAVKKIGETFRVSSWSMEKCPKPPRYQEEIEDNEDNDDCGEDDDTSSTKDTYEEIDFPDLQRAQLVEEKANEAIYALKSNIRTIKALRDAYLNLPDIEQTLKQLSGWFSNQLEPVLYDLEMHQATLETLSQFFKERKNLLLGILEFQNMQASRYFAEKSQISADTMECMTEEMRELTRQTKDETVSMTVIAGVTMFFLPGTFVSTLMSTDIVQWNPTPNGHFEFLAAPGARNLFLALTLPLMFATFVVWGIVGWQSRRRPPKPLDQR